MQFSDLIFLSETWLKDDVSIENLKIPGYEVHLNSKGAGKGIATYFKSEKALISSDTKKASVQITKLTTTDIDVINVYRSQGADNKEMIEDLKSIIDTKKTSIIAGDFNLCFSSHRANSVTKFLEEQGFTQHISNATHLMGGHIDHVYSNHDPNIYDVNVLMYSPYYTCQDHDALFITASRLQE